MPDVPGLYTCGPAFRSPLTIDHTQVPSTQSDFPVLVNVVDNRFRTVGNGGHVQNSSGFDIRPSLDQNGAYPLIYELERYNASTGEVIMWVRLPNIFPTVSTVFYVNYGNAHLSSDGSSAKTWDNNFYNVNHYTNGTVLSFFDSKLGANGTGNNTPTATAGEIDGAMALASASSQSMTTVGTSLAGTQLTMSAWVNATSFPNAYNAIMGYNVGPNTSFNLIMVKSTGKLAMYNQSRNYDGTGTNTLSSATWYYIVMTIDGTLGITGYVNGAVDGTAAGAAGVITGNNSFTIGNDTGNAGRFWNGAIDESRTISVVRSADWITCEYNNQKPSSTFITLGAEI